MYYKRSLKSQSLTCTSNKYIICMMFLDKITIRKELLKLRYIINVACLALAVLSVQGVQAQDEIFPINSQQEIAWLQQTLNLIGYECGPVDGVMGPSTRSCVRTLQKSKGVKVTGTVNEKTYKQIVKVLYPRSQDPSLSESEEAQKSNVTGPRPKSESEEQSDSEVHSEPQEEREPEDQPKNPTQHTNSELRDALETQTQFNTTGLFVRGYVSGNGLSGSGGTNTGRGLGGKLGYGFSPSITAYLGLNAASMEIGSIAYFDIGMQFNFSKGSALVPYVDVALSGIGDNAGNSGAGITGGGGIRYFVSPVFALDGGLFLNYSSIEGIDSITSARLNLGISWFPFQ